MVLWVSDPDVPVTVIVLVATGVDVEVVTVSAEVAAVTLGVTEAGLNEQLAPAGKDTEAQVSATALLKPFTAVTVTV